MVKGLSPNEDVEIFQLMNQRAQSLSYLVYRYLSYQTFISVQHLLSHHLYKNRYIRGFLIRRKIRPLLAERVEQIVAKNNPVEINDVKDELQVRIPTILSLFAGFSLKMENMNKKQWDGFFCLQFYFHQYWMDSNNY